MGKITVFDWGGKDGPVESNYWGIRETGVTKISFYKSYKNPKNRQVFCL